MRCDQGIRTRLLQPGQALLLCVRHGPPLKIKRLNLHPCEGARQRWLARPLQRWFSRFISLFSL